MEGTPEELDLGKRDSLVLGSMRAPLVAARTTKAALSTATVRCEERKTCGADG